MFGMGWMEILFILVIATVVLGPDKVLDTARLLGRTLGDLRRNTEEITRTLSLDQATLEADRKAPPSQAPQEPPPAPEGSQARGTDEGQKPPAGPSPS